MFAVIKTGGKQYKVASGDVLKVEKLAADAGETVQFNEILMLGGDSTTVGSPFVDGAAVQAEVVEQGRGPKLLNFKKRRRKHSSKRLKGHRQYLTEVKITEITQFQGVRRTQSGMIDMNNERATVRNVGRHSADISGWTLNCGGKGQDFTFPEGVLLPGQFLVIAADVAAFEAAYGARSNLVGGRSKS